MARIFALPVCILLIIILFQLDRKNIEGVSRAVWIPFVWMFLAGSRYVSAWLNLGAPITSAESYLEGSPVDGAVFLILTIAGAMVVIRRRFRWGELFGQNIWMVMFFIFAALSFIWSEYPFVSMKRWVKGLGNAVMALVILSEQRPYEALGVLLRRLSFVLLPLSVLFIRYYPELGRGYHMGTPMFTGVALQKNGLGQICLFSGVYFSWNLLLNRNHKADMEREPRFSMYMYIILLPMIAWLLHMANSATSTICMIIAVSFFMICRLPVVAREPRRIITIFIACIIFFGVMEYAVNFSNTVIVLLGREPDLTTRVPMWNSLIDMVRNPLIGFGIGGFWAGDRHAILMEQWGVSQAHNGYLQTYLDLGLIGVITLIGWILSGLRNVVNYLIIDYPASILRFCFILVIAFYNWTESALHGVSYMLVLFILGAMNIPCHGKSVIQNV